MKLSKLLLGAALVVGGVNIIGSGKVFAANRVDNVIVTPEIKMTEQGDAEKPIWVDYYFNKYSLDFTVNQDVKDGDYIEMETHALPNITTGTDIYASETDKTVIGKVLYLETKTARKQNTNGVADPNWLTARPEDNNIHKHKIVFNKNAEGRHNIKFSLGVTNGYAYYNGANRDYTTNAYVKINGKEIVKKPITIGAYPKTTDGTSMWLDNSTINGYEKDRITLVVGYQVDQDTTGAIVEISLPENSPIKFIKQRDDKRTTRGSNWRFTDSNDVSPNGLIHFVGGETFSYSENSQTDNRITFNITKQHRKSLSAGFDYIDIELTDEGKKYLAETGKLPEVKVAMKIVKDGKEIYTRPYSIQMRYIGEFSNFESKIKEEVKEIIKNTPAQPQSQPQQSTEIKAPNTGLSGQAFALLAISIMSAISTISIFIIKK